MSGLSEVLPNRIRINDVLLYIDSSNVLHKHPNCALVVILNVLESCDSIISSIKPYYLTISKIVCFACTSFRFMS
jgi:hypothetical protein